MLDNDCIQFIKYCSRWEYSKVFRVGNSLEEEEKVWAIAGDMRSGGAVDSMQLGDKVQIISDDTTAQVGSIQKYSKWETVWRRKKRFELQWRRGCNWGIKCKSSQLSVHCDRYPS